MGDNNKGTQDRNKYLISPGTHTIMMETVSRYLITSATKISAEDIKKFLDNHQATEVNGVKTMLANDNTSSLNDYILLNIMQYILEKGDKPSDYRITVILKHLSKSNPEIIENIPEVKAHFEASEKAFKDSLEEESTPRKLNYQQSKVAKKLDELGLFYKTYDRVEDYFRVQMHLPTENLIVEYLSPQEYLKTDDMKEERVYTAGYHFKKSLLEANGHKIVGIDFFDFIEADHDQNKLKETIQAKIENAKKGN